MALLSQPVDTLDAVIVCPRCGTKNPEGARFCLNCGSPLDERFHGRGAQGHHGPVLRPGRVHGTFGPGGPRGRQGDAPRLSHAAETHDRALRRHGRQVHRRRGARRVRRTDGPRGRPRARHPRRPADPGRRRGGQQRAAGPGARRPHRDQHRRGRDRVRPGTADRRERDGRRREHRVATAERRPHRDHRRRRGGAPRHRRRLRVRGAPAGHREREGGAARDLAAAPRAQRDRRRPARAAADHVRRPRRRVGHAPPGLPHDGAVPGAARTRSARRSSSP